MYHVTSQKEVGESDEGLASLGSESSGWQESIIARCRRSPAALTTLFSPHAALNPCCTATIQSTQLYSHRQCNWGSDHFILFSTLSPPTHPHHVQRRLKIAAAQPNHGSSQSKIQLKQSSIFQQNTNLWERAMSYLHLTVSILSCTVPVQINYQWQVQNDQQGTSLKYKTLNLNRFPLSTSVTIPPGHSSNPNQNVELGTNCKTLRPDRSIFQALPLVGTSHIHLMYISYILETTAKAIGRAIQFSHPTKDTIWTI